MPITEGVSMADLAAALNCEVLVVAQNIIGTLNHTFLSIEALRQRGVSRIKVILMEQAEPDLSAATNLRFITTTIENIGVYSIPRIQKCGKMCDTKLKGTKKLKKTLAQITSPDSFTSVVRNAAKAAKRKIEKQK